MKAKLSLVILSLITANVAQGQMQKKATVEPPAVSVQNARVEVTGPLAAKKYFGLRSKENIETLRASRTRAARGSEGLGGGDPEFTRPVPFPYSAQLHSAV